MRRANWGKKSQWPRNQHVRKTVGQTLIDCLISSDAQNAIGDHRIDGRQALFPNVDSPGSLPRDEITSACVVQSGGECVRAATPNPVAKVPSIAALARVGLMNARLMVMRIDRSLQRSRSAISLVSLTSPDVSWLSQYRPLAMPSTRRARASERIGF